MTRNSDTPLLLTPGPLTTSTSVKEAMLKDWGSRDTDFIEMTARVRRNIEAIAGVDPVKPTHTCVPIQGSGTFAVEAAITTLVPRDGKVIVLVNGAYGHRIVKICGYHGRAVEMLETNEDTPPSVSDLSAKLAADPEISHVVAVQCETTSGILNPLEDIAEACKQAGRLLIVDAMSSFGALPLDLGTLPCAAVIASSNKCLEGAPGIGFVIIEVAVLEACKGNAGSLSLDLHDQWTYMEASGQWRFTPPTHVLAALDQAIKEHEAEGGVAGRGERYRKNAAALIAGMRKLGFRPYLSDNLQAPIIITFHPAADDAFDFEDFYNRLRARGFAIYPGKLTKADSFRIGCIGHLTADDMRAAVAAVKDVVAEMGIRID
jgi:2-aminoethylphosphonate-pyruvate transaminase